MTLIKVIYNGILFQQLMVDVRDMREPDLSEQSADTFRPSSSYSYYLKDTFSLAQKPIFKEIKASYTQMLPTTS